MRNEDLPGDAEVNVALTQVLACLRQALDDVQAVSCSLDTPLIKMDQVGAVLEDLGDSLERCLDRVPG